MGVYIKGMDMPEGCAYCSATTLANCMLWVEQEKVNGDVRHIDCPLVEMDIPEKHRDSNGRFSSTPSDGKWVEIPSLDGEEWKPIKGFEGRYEVSNMGRVRNAVKILSQRQKTRYLQVVLSDGSDNRKTRMVHRLVAEAFVENPNPDLYKQVNHRDEDKHNNRADNLEWCTAKYNLSYGENPPIKNLRNAK